jgi:phosphatidylinositol alpha-1,6-mannosyltransferase
LTARLVENFTSFDACVVTLEPPAAEPRHSEPGIMRIGRRSPARLSVLALNVAAARAGLRQPPDVVLSMHIVCAPAVALIRATCRVGAAQYLYAKEVPARPRLARAAMQLAQRTICVSRHTRELALAAGGPAERIMLLHPGVDLPPPVSGEKESRPTIVTVARLSDRYKGHDVMVAALARIRSSLPEVQWVVIGDGPLRAELETAAQAAGVADAAQFLGAVDDAERDRWLARSHVFAMPSRVPPDRGGEGFGIVYLEAGAHGLPVVAGRAGGAVDAVLDGETGVLADADDPDSVADAILRLLGDQTLARAMGVRGRAHAERHTWSAVAAELERELHAIARSA